MNSLTPHEQRVLALAAKGLDDAAIAAEVGCSHGVVRKHLHLAYGKLNLQRNGINPRVSAVLWYLKRTGRGA